MNINKFTRKSQEAIEECQKLAYKYGNQEIDEEHLLYALLTIDESLILQLIEKMGIDKNYFLNSAEQTLNKKVKVQGGELRISQSLNQVLINAENEIKVMGDEYVSVEHLFLALIKYPNNAIKELFRQFGITRERFLEALKSIRGSQSVTTDNPEDTYDTLNKYARDSPPFSFGYPPDRFLSTIPCVAASVPEK